MQTPSAEDALLPGNKCRKRARGVYYGAVFEIKKEMSDDGHIDSRVQKCPLLCDRTSADHQ